MGIEAKMTDRAVLFSIKPKYCELIASGKKTVEVRKTRPKIPTPFKGYIYCTNPNTKNPHEILEIHSSDEKIRKTNGKVIGEFVCDYISMNIKGYNQDGVPAYWNLLNGSCLTADELDDYGRGRPLYGLHISDLKIYDKPKELSDFKKYNRTCYYSDLGLAIPKCSDCRDCNLKRAPQSWFYVQEV